MAKRETLTIEPLDAETRQQALQNPDWKLQYESFFRSYGGPTAERYLAMAWHGRNKKGVHRKARKAA